MKVTITIIYTEQLNTEQVIDTKFTDLDILFGPVYYMVRTVKVLTTHSGSYKDMSAGVIKDIIVSDVNDNTDIVTAVSCYPNPVAKEVNIKLGLEGLSNTNIEIFDSRGNLVKKFAYNRLAGGEHNLSWDLVSDAGYVVPQGVYYVRVSANDKVRVAKFTVVR